MNKIDKEALYPYLLFNSPIQYNDKITLYPITMENILPFQQYSQALCVRKNSRFPSKQIIKMSYLEFLMYTAIDEDIYEKFDISDIKNINHYFQYAIFMLGLSCKDQEVKYDVKVEGITINGCLVTPEIFDDLRKIIIIQNDIDFDDEFMNYDTEKRLKKAEKDVNKNADKATIEDYIDSLCIVLHRTENEIMNLTIRKFWRYVKRYNLHEDYTIIKTGECSGMVTMKEPVKHWMTSIDNMGDKYSNVKADEENLKKKITG